VLIAHETTPILSNPSPAETRVSTLQQAVEAAAASGSCLMFAQGDREVQLLKWSDLLDRAWRVAQHLLGLGLERGGRVIVMLPTSEAWATTFFGAILAGGVPVPVGPTFSFGGIERYVDTVRHIAKDAEARFFVGTEHVRQHLAALRAGNPCLEHFMLPDEIDCAPRSVRALPSRSPDDLAVLQYTSGTTSDPKGVMISHRALLANAYMIGERVGMSPRDTGVSWLPLFHDMGLVGALMTSLYWHYPLLLMPAEAFLMHPRRWLQRVTELRATLSVAPNFAYQSCVERISERHAEALDLTRWRCAFNGSEMVRPTTLNAFVERYAQRGFKGSAFLPVYGMAENTLAATFPRRGGGWTSLTLDRTELERNHRARLSAGGPSSMEIVSVGTPLAGTRVGIEDDSGRFAEPGVVGEIVIRSGSLMSGYFHNDEHTARALRDGWLHTGDLGFVHEGELFITGRAKELIIKRGRNYYPDDIESVAAEVGGSQIMQVAAFSCPNEAAGTEDIVLVLETKAIASHERETLDKAINGALIAAFGIRADATVFVPPRTIRRTTSGKVQRTALRAQYMQGQITRAAS
jgi:fatty-acyl-CoA synthase